MEISAESYWLALGSLLTTELWPKDKNQGAVTRRRRWGIGAEQTSTVVLIDTGYHHFYLINFEAKEVWLC